MHTEFMLLCGLDFGFANIFLSMFIFSILHLRRHFLRFVVAQRRYIVEPQAFRLNHFSHRIIRFSYFSSHLQNESAMPFCQYEQIKCSKTIIKLRAKTVNECEWTAACDRLPLYASTMCIRQWAKSVVSWRVNVMEIYIVKLKTLKNENQLRVASSSMHDLRTLAYYRVVPSPSTVTFCARQLHTVNCLRPKPKPNSMEIYRNRVWRRTRIEIWPITRPAHTKCKRTDFINRFMRSVSGTRRADERQRKKNVISKWA